MSAIKSKKVKILYVLGGVMNRGGIESFIMNYFRKIDKNKVHIDFIVHGFEEGVYDLEIKNAGSNIYNVPIKSENFRLNIINIREILKNGSYDIVHAHMDAMNFFVLKEAKKLKVPIRISHSHNTDHLTNNKIKYLINEYVRFSHRKYATTFMSCSTDAGNWLFGKNNPFILIKNAIETEKFEFNSQKRLELRKKYNIEDKLVIGNVGRFDYQKNHIYLINVFEKIYKKNNDTVLFLIGEGHLKENIIKETLNKSYYKNIIFAGNKENINDFYNCFDVYCQPSNFEGLGIVLIEAQINGLKCFASNNIPKETNLFGTNTYLKIDLKSVEVWASSIINYFENKKNVRNLIRSEDIDSSQYSIQKESKKLEEIYLTLYSEVKK